MARKIGEALEELERPKAETWEDSNEFIRVLFDAELAKSETRERMP